MKRSLKSIGKADREVVERSQDLCDMVTLFSVVAGSGFNVVVDQCFTLSYLIVSNFSSLHQQLGKIKKLNNRKNYL